MPRPDRASKRTALVIVRNTCTHDARVARTARALAGLGYSTRVLAVVSTDEQERASSIQGVEIARLAPQSPFARARRCLLGMTAQFRAGADRSGRSEGDRAAAGSGIASPREGKPPAWPVAVLLRLHRFLTTIDYYRLGIAHVRAARPTLVVCNDYNTMWIGVAARALDGCTVIYDSHELWPDRNGVREPRWWLLLSEALFVRAAHRTVTTSPGYADVLARRYRVSRPTVVRNIPDRAAAAPGHAGRSSGGEPVAIYVGGLMPGRGLEQAITAMAHAAEARLRILGPGSAGYIGGLRRLIDRLGVEARVEILPPVPPERVCNTIRDADVGLALIQPVCLSYSLSLPNKVFEYLAAGLPVLGSDLPVIGEFVRDEGVGCAVDPHDVRAIAARLSEMIEPERNRNLREVVAASASHLSWERESRLIATMCGSRTNGSRHRSPIN